MGRTGLRRKNPVVPGPGSRRAAGGQVGLLRAKAYEGELVAASETAARGATRRRQLRNARAWPWAAPLPFGGSTIRSSRSASQSLDLRRVLRAESAASRGMLARQRRRL